MPRAATVVALLPLTNACAAWMQRVAVQDAARRLAVANDGVFYCSKGGRRQQVDHLARGRLLVHLQRDVRGPRQRSPRLMSTVNMKPRVKDKAGWTSPADSPFGGFNAIYVPYTTRDF
jgi:hypothetical protein